MCGIFGCILKEGLGVAAAPLLHSALKRLEYRGYDCLKEDTLVQLADGTIAPVKDVKPGDVLTSVDLNLLNPTNGVVEEHFLKEKTIIYEINTQVFKVECSSEHRLFVWSGRCIEERRARDIKVGDFLLAVRNIPVDGSLQLLPQVDSEELFVLSKEGVNLLRNLRRSLSCLKLSKLLSLDWHTVAGYITGCRATIRERWQRIFSALGVDPGEYCNRYLVKKICGHVPKNVPKVRELEPRLAQVLGYLLGDGSTMGKISKIKAEDEEDVLVKYKELLSSIGIESRVVRLEKKACHEIRIYSAVLGRLIKKIAPELLAYSAERDIPQIVLKSPMDVVGSFLRGLFDAEALVNEDGINLSSSSERLLAKTQLLLLRFGVVTTLSKDGKKLNVYSPESIFRFQSKIGFSHPRKVRQLDELVRRLSLKRRKGGALTITPITYEQLQELIPAKVRAKRSSYISEHMLRRIIKQIKDSHDYPSYADKIRFLEQFILNPNYMWCRVTSIRKYSSVHLMHDLNVPAAQNFIANGLVVHNSAGVATITSEGIHIKKDVGKVDEIHARLNLDDLPGRIGLSHNRWATHGAPSKINAHPHVDCTSSIAVVHNGIIENFAELKAELEERGHIFKSKTDTEVIPHLIEESLWKGLSLAEAVREATMRLEGSYAIAVISTKEPDKIVCARKESPLVIGVAEEALYCASDIPAFLPLTNRAIVVDDGELVTLSDLGYEIRRISDWAIVERRPDTVDWTPEMAEKQGYPHFMLKEIYEQPIALRNSLRLQEPYLELMVTFLDRADETFLVACGTSYHACLAASYMFSKLASLASYPVVASEFVEKYGKAVDVDAVMLAVSQSGETADTLSAVEWARNRAATILGLTNVIGSTLTRVSRVYICQQSGPEIGVAATKTFTAQLLVLAQLALRLAKRKGKVSQEEIKRLERWLKQIPDVVEAILRSQEGNIRRLVEKYYDAKCFIFLGRGISTSTALEGQLKLMEVAYVPTIAYPAGEFKHGPISLIEPGIPAVFICPPDETRKQLIGNIMEMKARGASIIAIVEEGDERVKELADDYVEIPKGVPSVLSPIPYIIPLQLFAYHMAVKRGYDPDKPRNLAKSVTVK